MTDFFAGSVPYLLSGIVVYLVFRIWFRFLYRKSGMRAGIWYEAGAALLALWLLLLLADSLTPTLGFSWKPALKGACFLPIKGSVELVKGGGVSALLGAVFVYLPIGFLLPFLWRSYRKLWNAALLCGGLSVFTELFQLFLKDASTNVDTILWNLLGAFIGYFLFALLCYYLPEAESLGTVKRSRRRAVPVLVRKEVLFLLFSMLAVVLIQGTCLETARIKEEKAIEQEEKRREEEARKAAEEEEARRLAEEEAKKLKASEQQLSVSVEAQAACVYSVEEQLLYYDKNGTQRVAPASTTKLLTALTVLKYCGLEETVTAGEEIGLVSEDGTSASLKLGTTGTLETFLGAMLVPSGNDAAYVLAKYAGCKILGNENAQTSEAVAAFVEAMNTYAQDLDLEDSHFSNPDGNVAEGQYTTAYDLIRIARACLENETIRTLCGSAKYRALFQNMDVTYRNSNLLLQQSSEYYYEGAIGLKTGSNSDTKNLVAALEADGRYYISVVLQDSEEGRWKDTHTLFHALKNE